MIHFYIKTDKKCRSLTFAATERSVRTASTVAWAATDAGDRRDWMQRSTAGQLVGDLSAVVLSIHKCINFELQNESLCVTGHV